MSKPKKETAVTVANATTLDPVLFDDEAQMMASRVAALAAETQWDLPVTDGQALRGGELDAWLARKNDQAAVNAVERGIGYALKKRELGHGAFIGWIKDAGLNHKSVSEAMKIAQMLMSMSPANVGRALHLPQRNLKVLSSAAVPMLEDMFSEGLLDDAASMSRDELRELIKLRKKVEKQNEREERLNEVIAQQDEQIRVQRVLPKPKLHMLELRKAVLDEIEAIRTNAHTLQSVMDKIALVPDAEEADLNALAHATMFGLQGLYATASTLFERGFDTFTAHKRDMDVLPPALDEHEVERAQRMSDQFMRAAEQRAVYRQIDLHAAQTTKPAKPAKTPKKAKAK